MKFIELVKLIRDKDGLQRYLSTLDFYVDENESVSIYMSLPISISSEVVFAGDEQVRRTEKYITKEGLPDEYEYYLPCINIENVEFKLFSEISHLTDQLDFLCLADLSLSDIEVANRLLHYHEYDA